MGSGTKMEHSMYLLTPKEVSSDSAGVFHSQDYRETSNVTLSMSDRYLAPACDLADSL
jgi:hypothetical protein